MGESGRVITVDLSQEMLDEIARKAGPRNSVELICSSSLESVAVAVDGILLIAVLHEVNASGVFLKECFAKLEKHGRLIVIDWQKQESEHSPPIEHRIAKGQVMAMVEGKHVKAHPINENFYFFEFSEE